MEWVAFSSPEDVPNPGIEPASCTLYCFFTVEPICGEAINKNEIDNYKMLKGLV